MKNTIILFALLFISSWCVAQSSGIQNTIVYSLPKTVLCIDIEIEKTTHTQGILHQYSERSLGIADIVKETGIYHSFKAINVRTETVPDKNRTYTISWDNPKSALYNISLTEKGIICGINTIPASEAERKKDYVPHIRKTNEAAPVLPVTNNIVVSQKMAEEIAKQIYDIRENRQAILTGDIDFYPADGKSFALLLKEMDKKEKELTALFTGTKTTETYTRTIKYTPEKPNVNDVLFRLSTLKGVVPANDLSGAPYYINIAATMPQLVVSPQEKSKKQSNPIIRTIYPASAQIAINDGKTTHFLEEFLLPQLGSIVELTENLLRDNKIKIRIDPETGRLLGIEQN